MKTPIDYINPHATSTPVGDLKEIEAMREVFGSGDKCPPISATKSLTGHSQGATGVHEAIYSLLMMQNSFICESAHIDEIDPGVRRHADRARAARQRADRARCSPIPSASAAPTRRSCSSTSTRNDKEEVSGMKSGLMSGKRGLVMGVANDHSIAWGIAKALAAQGAELAFTYQGEALGKRVRPLAESVGSKLVAALRRRGHRTRSTPRSPRSARRGAGSISSSTASAFPTATNSRAATPTRRARISSRTMVISAFSFTEIAKRAAAMMPNGGSMLTLTFGGSTRVMPNYNVMGVAKAALEASVRYLAADFGPAGIRVNAISAGPIRTLAGAGIADARFMFNFQRDHSPLRRTVTIEDVGGAALYLLSDLVGRRDRRNPFRRRRLQHHLDAAPRGHQKRRRDRSPFGDYGLFFAQEAPRKLAAQLEREERS